MAGQVRATRDEEKDEDAEAGMRIPRQPREPVNPLGFIGLN
jgi:hypothetical protein